MNAPQYLEKHGREKTKAVCEAAGTSLAYFQQVVDGKRSFGRKTAEALELASAGEMTRVELVFGSDPPPPLGPPSTEESEHVAP